MLLAAHEINAFGNSGGELVGNTPHLVIPESVQEAARQELGPLFAAISRSDPETVMREHLDASRAIMRAEILGRYVSLQRKKLLEVGSGFGTNLAMWLKLFDLDGYRVEPDRGGFATSFRGSREIFAANQLDSSRILPAVGEKLPFADCSFDIVYSANVLEHTDDPAQVMSECLRVLRPKGIFHFEVPNFLSWFEGHYMVFQPPILSRWMLPFWIRYIYGRDPAYARTLRTYINPVWLRRTLNRISRQYPLTIVSTGEELFLERFARPFRFEMNRTGRKLETLVLMAQKLNVGNWIGRSIVLLKGHYPLFFTVRREDIERMAS